MENNSAEIKYSIRDTKVSGYFCSSVFKETKRNVVNGCLENVSKVSENISLASFLTAEIL